MHGKHGSDTVLTADRLSPFWREHLRKCLQPAWLRLLLPPGNRAQQACCDRRLVTATRTGLRLGLGGDDSSGAAAGVVWPVVA